jgi:predicted dehydrogenase
LSNHVGKPKVLLVGAGPMAAEYAKVLHALEVPFEGVSRSAASAERFAVEAMRPVRAGGVASIKDGEFSHAIVAVDIPNLAIVATELAAKSIPNLLIEKPGALRVEELKSLAAQCLNSGTKALIGYNRRYYSSVLELKRRLESEPLVSAHFEFTEWSHRLVDIPMPEEIKSNWLIANSSHVIDLAFHLMGPPSKMNCTKAEVLDWHPAGAVFVGSGTSDRGVAFTYHSNWIAPGRWSVEVLTRKNKYILRPMEELRVQPLGKLEGEKVEIDDTLDKKFKPGLYHQTESFLLEKWESLVTLNQQVDAFQKIYEPILQGES